MFDQTKLITSIAAALLGGALLAGPTFAQSASLSEGEQPMSASAPAAEAALEWTPRVVGPVQAADSPSAAGAATRPDR